MVADLHSPEIDHLSYGLPNKEHDLRPDEYRLWERNESELSAYRPDDKRMI